MQRCIKEIATALDLDFEGDGALKISGLCGLTDNSENCLSFALSARHVRQAAASRIPAFVTKPNQPVSGKVNIFHDHPEYAMALIAGLFKRDRLGHEDPAVHPSAIVSPNATVASNVFVGANVVIGDECTIGDGTKIYPNVVVHDRSILGVDCVIHANTTIREDSILGDRVILQPGVVIGGDGYGYAQYGGEHVKIPHLGNVIIENDVEIGANTTIDRGRFSETRIGKGTKIDNLCMLGHNCATGDACLLVSQVGMSGSTKLGDRVILGGQVGTAGHLSVTDDVTVMGRGGITNDIKEPGVYGGFPVKPVRIWRRAVARFYAGLSE
ncbi:MAG: UDP-3-O-(3-hydroxymyristoyl)glucosamine N-acyltransferase [Pseudomonadota bacterium]